MQIQRNFSIFAAVLSCGFIALISLASANQDIPESSAAPTIFDYSDELKRYDFDIEVQTIKAVNQLLKPNDYAISIKLNPPIYPPVLTVDQVKLKIAEEIQALINQHFPDATYEKIKNDADEKFKMYKVGETVTIQRHYANQLLEVKGLLEVVSNDIIKISSIPIPKRDIARDDLARLFLADHEDAVRIYVQREVHKFEEKRKEYIEKAQDALTNKVWTKAGYLYNRRTNKWVPVMDIFNYQYSKAREKEMRRVRQEIREKVYKQNNYVNIPERGGWIPQQVLDMEVAAKNVSEEAKDTTFLAKFKAFINKKTEAEGKPLTTNAEETSGTDEPENPDLWLETDIPSDKPAASNSSPTPPSAGDTKPPATPPAPVGNPSDLFDESDN